MDIIQALVIAILQGATELFPGSSLGHAVVLPALLHWGIDQRSAEFLPFLVMLHLGTATALLGYFWKDWWAITTGVLGIGGEHQVRESRRVFVLVVIATIPATIRVDTRYSTGRMPIDSSASISSLIRIAPS